MSSEAPKKFEIPPLTPPKRAPGHRPPIPPLIPPGMFPDGDNGPRTPPRNPYRSTSADDAAPVEPDYLIADDPMAAYTDRVKPVRFGGLLRQKGEGEETPARVTAAYRRTAGSTGDDTPTPGEITQRRR